MFSIRLKIPRTIYINSRIPSDDKEFNKVNRILPRGRRDHYLYEWKKDESVF